MDTIDFHKIDLAGAAGLKRILEAQPYRTCDYTVGAIFQWRAYFNTRYAIVSDMLVQMASYPGEGPCCYAFPVGDGDLDAALAAIERDAAARGLPLTFCAVPEQAKDYLLARYGQRACAHTHRDWADYLYEAEGLIQFPGKKYHGQRNHLNRFIKENPNWKYVPVTQETLPLAMTFLSEYEKHAPIDKVIEAEEMLRARELLCDALKLHQTAGYVETDGVIVALAVGEVIRDTLYVHVEKARLDYPGAYQAIVSAFTAAACAGGVPYVNREDDSGEEGLRRSKLSYQPVALLDKYWVYVK